MASVHNDDNYWRVAPSSKKKNINKNNTNQDDNYLDHSVKQAIDSSMITSMTSKQNQHTVVYAEYSASYPACYVIVTSQSLLWTILTVVTTCLLSASIMTPHWLETKPRPLPHSRRHLLSPNLTTHQTEQWETIGIFNGCKGRRRLVPSVSVNLPVTTDKREPGDRTSPAVVFPQPGLSDFQDISISGQRTELLRNAKDDLRLSADLRRYSGFSIYAPDERGDGHRVLRPESGGYSPSWDEQEKDGKKINTAVLINDNDFNHANRKQFYKTKPDPNEKPTEDQFVSQSKDRQKSSQVSRRKGDGRRRGPSFPALEGGDLVVETLSRHRRKRKATAVVVDLNMAMSDPDADFAERCSTYVTGLDMSSEEFPDMWKSSLIFLASACTLMTFTNFTALLSVCVQSMFRKSIFTVSGLIQSVAALFLVLGQLLYLTGWGSVKVKNMCGDRSGPFTLDQCHLGWSFYGCVVGTGLVFACALLSIRAETSTSTDRVEKAILDGSSCVCCP